MNRSWLRALLTSALLLGVLSPCPAGQTPALPQAKPPAEPASPYLVESLATRVQFESDGTNVREICARYRIQTEEGARQFARLSFEYNRASERVEIRSIRVEQSSGGSMEILARAVADRPLDAVKDSPAYEDAREKTVRVPGLKPGDILEYQVVASLTHPPAPGRFWFEHTFTKSVPAREETLEISLPAQSAVQWKRRAGFEPLITDQESAGSSHPSRRLFRWKFSRLQQEQQPDEPNNTQSQDIQLTSFESWEDLARWFHAPPAASPSPPEIAAKAAELARGLVRDEDRLEALYTFVAQRIRTVALPLGAVSFHPRAPSDVLASGYGTALDKQALLQALAGSLSLRAVPLLVHSIRAIDRDFPSPAQFDHVIAFAALGTRQVFLDPSTEVAPFDMLTANLRGKPGLAVGSGPAGVSASWVTPPLDPPMSSTQRVAVTARLTPEGYLEARIHYTLRGDNELLLRVAFHRASPAQWNTLAQLLIFSDGFRGDVTSVKASDPFDTRSPFEVETQLVWRGFVDWKKTPVRILLPLPVLGLPEVPPANRRQNEPAPLNLGTPLEIETRLELSLPARVSAQTPVPVRVARDYAEYRSAYAVQRRTIRASRDLKFLLRELPGTRRQDYAAFVRAVQLDEGQEIVLRREPAPPRTPRTAAKNAASRRAP